jgi:serralysin
VDIVNLRAVDAQVGPGNQRFNFIGTAPFSSIAGELRVKKSGSSAIIQGDVDGDSNADLEIELLNFTTLSTLTEIDFGL